MIGEKYVRGLWNEVRRTNPRALGLIGLGLITALTIGWPRTQTYTDPVTGRPPLSQQRYAAIETFAQLEELGVPLTSMMIRMVQTDPMAYPKGFLEKIIDRVTIEDWIESAQPHDVELPPEVSDTIHVEAYCMGKICIHVTQFPTSAIVDVNPIIPGDIFKGARVAPTSQLAIPDATIRHKLITFGSDPNHSHSNGTNIEVDIAGSDGMISSYFFNGGWMEKGPGNPFKTVRNLKADYLLLQPNDWSRSATHLGMINNGQWTEYSPVSVDILDPEASAFFLLTMPGFVKTMNLDEFRNLMTSGIQDIDKGVIMQIASAQTLSHDMIIDILTFADEKKAIDLSTRLELPDVSKNEKYHFIVHTEKGQWIFTVVSDGMGPDVPHILEIRAVLESIMRQLSMDDVHEFEITMFTTGARGSTTIDYIVPSDVVAEQKRSGKTFIMPHTQDGNIDGSSQSNVRNSSEQHE